MLLNNELLVWLSLIFPFAGTALVPIVVRLGQSVRTAFAVLVGFCTAGTVLLLLPDIWLGVQKDYPILSPGRPPLVWFSQCISTPYRS